LHVSVPGVPATALQAVLEPEHTTVPDRAQGPIPTVHAAPICQHVPEQSVWPDGQAQMPPAWHIPPLGVEHEP